MAISHTPFLAAIATAMCVTGNVFAQTLEIEGSDGSGLRGEVLETFDSPWAMTYLPDGRSVVTEKGGSIWLLGADGKKLGQISNAPRVTARGQGGLGDVILHPDFENTGQVYISYVERDENDNRLSGAALVLARLNLNENGGSLADSKIIWRQSPKVTGNGHYSLRLSVSPDNRYLFITSGDRQKFTPSQNMEMNLGKILRLNLDGSVPSDNPFIGQGKVTEQIWSLGHRNPLGIDFDANGQLWAHEMGPRNGDELNRVVRSENYGWPEVSNGRHYSGAPIPDHDTNPAFENPALYWVPAISPAGFVIYDGNLFGDWKGDGFIGGLSSQALVRVTFQDAKLDNTGAAQSDVSKTETVASEAARYEWGKRIREVEQAPDGAIMVLEDQSGGRLIRLTPAS